MKIRTRLEKLEEVAAKRREAMAPSWKQIIEAQERADCEREGRPFTQVALDARISRLAVEVYRRMIEAPQADSGPSPFDGLGPVDASALYQIMLGA